MAECIVCDHILCRREQTRRSLLVIVALRAEYALPHCRRGNNFCPKATMSVPKAMRQHRRGVGGTGSPKSGRCGPAI